MYFFSQGDIVNGITETFSGKKYDSPPYTVVSTYEVGRKSVSTIENITKKKYVENNLNKRMYLKDQLFSEKGNLKRLNLKWQVFCRVGKSRNSHCQGS